MFATRPSALPRPPPTVRGHGHRSRPRRRAAQLPRRALVRRRPDAPARALQRRAGGERGRAPRSRSTSARPRWASARARATTRPRARSRSSSPASRSTTPRCSCARSRAGSSSSTSPRTTSASAACAAASARAPAHRAPARCAPRSCTWPSAARPPPSCARCSPSAELRLVMTAHPTEARRRTTVEKLARIFARLRDLDERLPVPGDEVARPPRARGHDPGAVGLRRGPRRLPHPARRGPRGPRLLRLDAAPRRAGALPRARGGGRGGLPGRGDRGAAAAHVRLLDGRRPRRQPERHGRRHRGGARDDADRLPAPARGADRAARPARLAVRPARRPLARDRGGAGAARRALPRRGRAARAPQPGGALPALLLAVGRARARDARGRARTATSHPRSCSPTCARPSARCGRARGSSSPPPSCTT